MSTPIAHGVDIIFVLLTINSLSLTRIQFSSFLIGLSAYARLHS